MSDAEIHGLVYPPAFLDALPVLHHRPDPHQPIRALSAADFARIHLAHLTSHAPDHVLFPFLHGLEGDNDAQNSFFAASHSPAPDLDDLDDDDDEDDEVDSCSTGSSLGPSDIDDDVPMDIDPSIAGPLVPGCPPPELDLKLSPPLVSAAPPVPRNGRLPSPRAHSHTHHPAILTSSFRPRELIRTKTNPDGSTSPIFIEPKIPHGISLRNFGIQVPIYATLCDIVVYSPKGLTRSALAVAHKFKQAVETKHDERRARCSSLVPYNVFVLEATPADMMSTLRHLVARMEPEDTGAHTDGPDAHTRGESTEERRVLRPNTIDFAQREKEEMRDLTQASEIVTLPDDVEDAGAGETPLAGSTTSSHWDPMRGQVFLGNSNDVPLPPDRRIRMRTLREDDGEDAFDWRTNDPAQGLGYDICIECHDYAPFPTSAHLRAAEEHMRILDRRWVEKCLAEMDDNPETLKRLIPPRPPPNAAYVVHLPLPSSPASSVVTLNTLVPFLSFLEKLIQPLPGPPLTYELACEQLAPPSLPSRPSGAMSAHVRRESTPGFHPSSLPPPSSFPTSFFPSPASPQSAYTRVRSTSATFLPSSPTSSSCSSSPTTLTSSPTDSTAPVALHTRPAKLLIYSADGYTESSVLALSMLMSLRTLSLPEAYLTLQVEKRRSFFVYQSDLSLAADRGAAGERSHSKQRRDDTESADG
ncbi:hypothetical protein A0H81_13806 [Grifola frondosa]|uniref:Uncharacterized protein n=1 Tax=Grifola frondosa TaxID=5627 RepID=A0A1C7LTR6_GRIFR|nr:hypothetical protein A0H81_13806 [Grifola frondosa]